MFNMYWYWCWVIDGISNSKELHIYYREVFIQLHMVGISSIVVRLIIVDLVDCKFVELVYMDRC